MTDSNSNIDNFHQLILDQLKEIRRENREEIRNLKQEILEKIEEKSGEMREIIDENEKEAEERILEVQRKMETLLVPIEDVLEKIGEKMGISTGNLEESMDESFGRALEFTNPIIEEPSEILEQEENPVNEEQSKNVEQQNILQEESSPIQVSNVSKENVLVPIENILEEIGEKVGISTGNLADFPNPIIEELSENLETIESHEQENQVSDEPSENVEVNIPQENEKVEKIPHPKVSKISIKEALIGNWNMTSNDNEYGRIPGHGDMIVSFHEVMQFKKIDGQLMERSDWSEFLPIDDKYFERVASIFDNENHWMSINHDSFFIDQYIDEDDILHITWRYGEAVWRLIYERVCFEKMPIEQAVIGMWEAPRYRDSEGYLNVTDDKLEFEITDGQLMINTFDNDFPIDNYDSWDFLKTFRNHLYNDQFSDIYVDKNGDLKITEKFEDEEVEVEVTKVYCKIRTIE